MGKKLVAALADVDNADKLALSSMKTYKDIEAAVKELELRTEASVRSGLADLATALKTINPELKQFNKDAGSRSDKIVAKLEQTVSEVVTADGKITKVVVGGLDIADVVEKLAVDSKTHDWKDMGKELKKLYDLIEAE